MIGPGRRTRTGAIVIALAVVALIGVPVAYRLATESAPAAQSPVPAVASSSPSGTAAPTLTASGLSDTDRALERLGVVAILEELTGPGVCHSESIPMTRDRSTTLGGRVDAHDHAGWVITCDDEAGDRARYFRLASGVAAELSEIGAAFQGGASYIGRPGATLETRWIVSGDVLSGEIEMLAVPTAPGTLTIVVLLDLRGSWQGAAPSS